MKFCIKYNSRNLIIEAESVICAVIKIIDLGFGVTDNTEFQIAGLINNSYYQGDGYISNQI